MKRYISFSLLLLGLTVSATSFGFHFDKSQQTLQFGGTMNTGNSENTNVTAAFDSDVEKGKYEFGNSIEGQLSSSGDVESARSVKTNANINYHYSQNTFFFVKGSINFDKYATYDFLIREVAGIGRTILKNTRQELSIEAGPGGIHRRVSGTEDFQNEPIFNMSGNYSYHISKTAEFKQTFSTYIGRLNTHIETKSAISTKIVKNLALELSFTVNHDTKIPPLSQNTKKTDTQTKATVVYTF